MDVTGSVEEEEARAGERVVASPGDFDDAYVVVSGFELGDGFDFVGWDSVVVAGSSVAAAGEDWVLRWFRAEADRNVKLRWEKVERDKLLSHGCSQQCVINIIKFFFMTGQFQTFGQNSMALSENKKKKKLYHCSRICKGHQDGFKRMVDSLQAHLPYHLHQ